jgi:hypothetical protein
MRRRSYSPVFISYVSFLLFFSSLFFSFGGEVDKEREAKGGTDLRAWHAVERMRGCGLRGIDNSAGHGRSATVINVDGEGIGADVRISAVCSFVSVFRIAKEEIVW